LLTSPLIFLARSGHLELLKVFADEVWVPEPVAAETLHRRQHDITARVIDKTDWLIRKPVGDIPIAVLDWRLGAGESAVLALAIDTEFCDRASISFKKGNLTKYPLKSKSIWINEVDWVSLSISIGVQPPIQSNRITGDVPAQFGDHSI